MSDIEMTTNGFVQKTVKVYFSITLFMFLLGLR